MKKLLICLAVIFSLQANAQDTTAVNQADFELGSGLNFNFNKGKYAFKISGMVQPNIAFDKYEDEETKYYFNTRRTYFNIGGNAVDEKISFFLQLDFSRPNSLLDAWIALEPVNHLQVQFGQQQTIANNLEIMVMATFLQFPDRWLISLAPLTH